MTTNPHEQKKRGIMEKVEEGPGGAREDEDMPGRAYEDAAACEDRTTPSGGALPLCTVEEAMERRHSVRSFTGQRIEGPVLAALCDELDACNREGGLRMQVVLDEPRAFSSMLARYGKFANVRNYVAINGKTADDLDGRAGYYGERLVLAAQALGLNTCWAALTFSKRQVRRLAGPEERLVCALALGYGATQGRPRKSKAPEDVSRAAGKPPEWFERGVRAALLAPTALNQQKFRFELLPDGKTVRAQTLSGAYTAVDLGIAKYHFEVGAGTGSFAWV